MSLRFPICLIALVIALPLAVAGCGNSGPLVLPDAVPVEADIDSDSDVEQADAVDPVEALGENPIPAAGGDEAGND